MKRYAQIDGNYVSNIIATDSKEDAESMLGSVLVEITEENNAGIGYAYDSQTGLFVNPNPLIQEFSEEIYTE